MAGLSSPRRPASLSASLLSVRSPDGLLLGVVDADGVVEARDLEDVAVVVGEAVGEEPLFLAVDADEQRDQEPDAATVHVLQALEVQDYRSHAPVAGLVVGVHQDALGEGGELALDVDDAHFIAYPAHLHRDLCLGHVLSPFPIYLPYSLELAAQGVERAVQLLPAVRHAAHLRPPRSGRSPRPGRRSRSPRGG